MTNTSQPAVSGALTDRALDLADHVTLLDSPTVAFSGGISHASLMFVPATSGALLTRLGGTRDRRVASVSTLGADATRRGLAELCPTVEEVA